MTNLLEGDVYVFRVLAANAQGEGEPLECFVPVSARPSNPVPEKPAAPKIAGMDKKWAKLEWFVPADAAAGIKYYIIEKQEHFMVPKVNEEEDVKEETSEEKAAEEEEAAKPVKPVLKTGPSFSGEYQEYTSSWMTAMMTEDNSNSAKVTDLGEGHKYRFRLRAVNAAGHSQPSEPSKEVVSKGKQRPIIER